MSEARYLTIQGVADHLSMSRATVARLIERGKLPAPIDHMGDRLKRWDRFELDACMKSEPTSAARNWTDVTNDIADEIAKGRLPTKKTSGRR
jgi:excisionase family DNA binding protein